MKFHFPLIAVMEASTLKQVEERVKVLRTLLAHEEESLQFWKWKASTALKKPVEVSEDSSSESAENPNPYRIKVSRFCDCKRIAPELRYADMCNACARLNRFDRNKAFQRNK
jgi:hypothetical protein